VDGILTWMESAALARFILDHAWVFPTLETLHFIGLILLMGSVCVLDLRFLGFAPRIPMASVLALIPVALAGFAINLLTGIGFLFTDPAGYYFNTAFRLKVLAIVLAGLNAVWFKLASDWESLPARSGTAPRPTVRWIAGISLVLWTFIIVMGRMIPYLP
jgi:hypothetical protein